MQRRGEDWGLGGDTGEKGQGATLFTAALSPRCLLLLPAKLLTHPPLQPPPRTHPSLLPSRASLPLHPSTHLSGGLVLLHGHVDHLNGAASPPAGCGGGCLRGSLWSEGERGDEGMWRREPRQQPVMRGGKRSLRGYLGNRVHWRHFIRTSPMAPPQPGEASRATPSRHPPLHWDLSLPCLTSQSGEQANHGLVRLYSLRPSPIPTIVPKLSRKAWKSSLSLKRRTPLEPSGLKLRCLSGRTDLTFRPVACSGMRCTAVGRNQERWKGSEGTE